MLLLAHEETRRLPHAPQRAGELKDVIDGVHGPVVITHSRHDTAVRRLYRIASKIQRQDAAAAARLDRWGAIGANGAQAVDAAVLKLQSTWRPYNFSRGRFYNLNGDDVIKHPRPIMGAHSDIFHPQIAWATLSASLLGPP